MKKLLSALAIAAASTALAVESSNTFGILRVDSSSAQTIVSIPWLAAGGGNIKVKDVVKTANLTPKSDEYIGDQLYYYDTTAETPAYKMWRLTSTGWEGVKIVTSEVSDPVLGTDDDKLARGGALILVRKNPSVPFYLYGQYKAELGSYTINRGVYALIASPSTDGLNLNEATWTGVNASDRIFLPNGKILYYNNSKWSSLEFNETTGDDEYTPYATTIPAGTGVWLKTASGDGSVTVAW